MIEAEGLGEARYAASDNEIDVALIDLRSLGPEALVAFQAVKRFSPGAEIILLTSPEHIALSIKGMKLGAFDDLMSPVDVDDLFGRVRHALEAAGKKKRKTKRKRAAARAGGRAGASRPESETDTHDGEGDRIMEDIKLLLVDDEEDFLESLSERLAMRELSHETAADGEQALKQIRDDEPTVIVLDLRMPGMDGLEVLRQVKKAHPKVQVVILTGHGTDEDKKQAERMGAFAYLKKPVEMDTLLETVKRAHQKFKSIKEDVDTAFMASAMAQAGEVDIAREMMKHERHPKK